MKHSSTFKIRTFHTDAFGHVNNARHLEILEEARWQFAEDIGLMPLLRREELGFIIIDMRMRFREPVFEGDRVQVTTSLITLGTASGEVKQLMHKSDKRALDSLFHFILVRRSDGKSVPIEGEIRKLLLGVIDASDN